MKMEKKYIQNLISANNHNTLAIFVGAGTSKSSETSSTKLPTWGELISDLKSELQIENENDYLKIAQLYYLAFGEFTYYKKIREYFPESINPSKIHKLIFDINPHVIITTNWDTLLEKTMRENGYIYDIVCSDNDLVRSSLQNKLIKMHGDFNNYNIVFKEDDYLNYNRSFPLVENFVKSILSTHTILFIGYSYNDFNLKQIVKWIQNYSKVKPPMYLVTGKRDNNQIKYLENHGITTLVIENFDKSLFSPKDELDEYSKGIYTFLSRVLTKDQVNIADDVEDTIDFILGKLETLDELEGILIEQIKGALTNCGYIYDSDSLPILEFYDELLTSDLSENTRAIHLVFKEILKKIDNEQEKPSPKILKIFEILSKARIKGIVISNNMSGDKEYIEFKKYIKLDGSNKKNNFLDFDFDVSKKLNSEFGDLFELALQLYNLEKLEESFATIEDTIKTCLKERNYTKLFIAMFNRNILLRKIKFSIMGNEIRDKYKNLDEYNLKERYQSLTKDLKYAIEPIFEFVDFSFIYRYAYNTANDLRKKEKETRTIESGGMIIGSEVYQFSSKHENLVNFVLENGIMIEDLEEYKSINRSFVKIALIRQLQKEKVSLSKTELYSCIKYIEYSDLRLLFDEYYNNESSKKGKFELTKDLKGWLIETVLENVVDQYLELQKPFTQFEIYIKNIMFLLSLLKHDQEEVKNILDLINKMLEKGKNTLAIFESINFFLGIQHNLHGLEIEKSFLIEMIETLIRKLVYKKFTGHEYIALTRNELSNLYGYANITEVVFENEDLVEKLLNEVKTYPISEKIEITQNFILNLYAISNNNIKNKIKDFALSFDLTEEHEDYKKIVFENTLVIFDLKAFSSELMTQIENYLEPFKDGRRFSTILYMLDSQIDYLLTNKKVIGLNNISETLKKAIRTYNEGAKISIF